MRPRPNPEDFYGPNDWLPDIWPDPMDQIAAIAADELRWLEEYKALPLWRRILVRIFG